MTRRPAGMRIHLFALTITIAAVIVFAVTAAPATPQGGAPAAPAGVTAIALDGKVGLAWQASADATGYVVYRGSSPSSITENIGATADRSFTDSSAVNGQTYVYAVRASSAGGPSAASTPATATPRARSCSTGNPVVVENCFPGTTAWKSPNARLAGSDSVEGFASASSIDAGESVDLRIYADPGVPYRIEIYRTGSYGGDQGRLVGVLPGRTGAYQPPCFREESTTGIVDCSEWAVSTTLSTTSDWVSGAYLLKLVREDNGRYNEILLVVRNDESHSDVVYKVPTATYQAYNNYNGKALYNSLSDTPNTIANATRAVKVSFDRPYSQPGVDYRNDWYTHNDVASVGWLEEQGYDVAYIADEDLHADAAHATRHEVMVTGSHDEYWTQAMYDHAIAARDAGTSLVFMGANAVYWRTRHEPSPLSDQANRVVVTYKTIQGGPPDPSGPTSTWRDPAGPNRPENELIGQMYAGDNSASSFPLQVSAAEGRHRLWRYTTLAEQAAGATASIGTALVGWEWDNRVDNGSEPAGVETVASSSVNGGLIQGNGAFQSQGNTVVTATIYRAASGALVFATGTNNWWRGLGRNVRDEGEPSTRIQQATVNVLTDMGVLPATPGGGIAVDSVGPPAVVSATPADGAGGVAPNSTVRITFDREVDPGTFGGASLTMTGPGGASVEATASIDNGTRTATLRPTDALEPFSDYTVRLAPGLKSWHGEALAAALTWSFTTGPGTPPVVTSRTPLAGATGVPTDTAVTARFDRRLDGATVTPATATLRTTSGTAVTAAVSYDDPTRTVRLVPDQRLAETTSYTVELTTGIQARDATPMDAPASWTFSTGSDLQVTARTPAPLAGGVSPAAAVRAVLSRAADATSVTAGSFTLRDGGGQAVPASVSYDPVTRTATLAPLAPLVLLSTYTATIGGAIHATDGAPLAPSVWSFTTAAVPPPSPVATGLSPAAEATGVVNDAVVRASFDLPLDPATVSEQTFRLTPDGGQPVAATVTYDAAARRAALTPRAPLAIGTRYTTTLTTDIRSTTGAPLTATATWGFTTAECPCSLMGNLTPDWRDVPVRDNRPGAGPWSYELGTKVTVQDTAELVALRYFKERNETGTHVGRVWNAAGVQIASATFANESASGWQRTALAAPVTLQPGQVYTVSVGVHNMYAKTAGGLANQLASGPLRTVADGSNGAFALTAGAFPTDTWGSSNYFVDAVVKLPGSPSRTPAVTNQSPLDGATGVGVHSSVSAGFSVPLDASTVTAQSFTLTDAEGQAVSAQAAYDADAQSATLTPSQPLEYGTAYTARLATSIRSDDESPLAAPVSWTFATAPPIPPTVVSTSPAQGAGEISDLTTVAATFSQAMATGSLDAQGFRLLGPGGAEVPATMSYDAATHTATLQPTSPLLGATTYTAEVTTSARSAKGLAIEVPASWTFTTSACPCTLHPGAATEREYTGLSTRNGRDPASTWTLELGVKVRVTQPARLEAVRFYKDADETGQHAGRVWTADGTLVASVAFAGESGSGWQQQALSTPIPLAVGQTYVVSVGVNSAFGMTPYGLSSALASGPLRSVTDGQNGVYGDAAGAFPTNSWGSSDYFVDAVIR